LKDFGADGIDVQPDAIILKSDHVEAELLQVSTATHIFDAAAVLSSIQFHDQMSFEADKVRDIAADRVLPPEFKATQPPAANTPPKSVFNVHWVTPH
jgi:hypothetical protein